MKNVFLLDLSTIQIKSMAESGLEFLAEYGVVPLDNTIDNIFEFARAPMLVSMSCRLEINHKPTEILGFIK